jgi:hypothetical protein
LANPVRWTIGQGRGHFFASAPDRFLVHTGNLGQQAVAAMPDPGGFHGHIPAALSFVEATEQQIHLLVQQSLRMVAFPTAARALAERYIKRGHTPSSVLSGENRPPLYTCQSYADSAWCANREIVF